jgi:hypothetical protein
VLEQSTPIDAPRLDADAFAAAFGEPLSATLDLRTWRAGEDLATLYGRLAEEVAAAVAQEARVYGTFRKRVFPRIRARAGAPPHAGVHRVGVDEIAAVHQGLLFNGGVEACDGTVQAYDTLPLTVYQVGVGLVAYQGGECTWVQRLYRRDLRAASVDPTEEALTLLARREGRGGVGEEQARDELSRLASQAIMSYAERAILLRQASAPWRLGHGSPAPFELLTGSGSRDLMIEATRLLEALICDHQRFVFVPSAPARRLLLTIGQALRPLEYAVVDWYADHIAAIVERGEYYGTPTVDTTIGGRRLTQ